MHCPGDENIIPLYRPDDATPGIATSTSKASNIVEHITQTHVSVAAPKSDVTSEENIMETQVTVAAPRSDMTSEENITATQVSVAVSKSDMGLK
jgi:hypothetical protein